MKRYKVLKEYKNNGDPLRSAKGIFWAIFFMIIIYILIGLFIY